MKFSASERRALSAWMTDKGLSHAKVAKLLRVSTHSVTMWCHGGGASPTLLSKLRRFIDPYIHANTLSPCRSSLPIVREKLQQAGQFQPHTAKFFSAYLDQLEIFTGPIPIPTESFPLLPCPILVSPLPVPSLTKFVDIPTGNQPEKHAPPIEPFPLLPCRILVSLLPVPSLPDDDPTPIEVKLSDTPMSDNQPGFLFMPDRAMEPNFLKSEKLAIVPFADGVLHKSPNMGLKTFVKRAYSLLSPGAVVAVSVQGSPVTCRRLIYLGSANTGGRELILSADNNAHKYTALAITPHSSVTIFGKVSRYKAIQK